MEANAAQVIGRTFGVHEAWLHEGLGHGFYKSACIRVESVARYLVIFHITDQKALFINAAAQLTAGYKNFAALVEGMKQIAADNACNAIEGITIRAGVLKALLAEGFEPMGVSVKLAL